MRTDVPKRLIIAALVVVLALLSGCSVLRIGYGQAPELVYWWLDAYADFDDAQSPRVRDALVRWFAWHRRTQLGAYADALARAQGEMLADTTPDRACAWWDWARHRAVEAATEAVPQAVDLMAGLSPAQLQHIERRQAKANAEFRDEYLAADPRRRIQDSVDRTIDRAESLYGRLDDAQRERVARSVAASPFDAELWLAERQRRQQELVQILHRVVAEPSDRDNAVAGLRAWIEHVARSPRPEHRRHADRLTQYNCAFAASLHNSTAAAQRQAAAQKLRRWELDLRALVAD